LLSTNDRLQTPGSEHGAEIGTDGNIHCGHRFESLGGQGQLGCETEDVDHFRVAGAEKMCSEDTIGCCINDDLRRRGSLADSVIELQTAGVVVAHNARSRH
jgi:hypothetical protein